MTAMRRIMLLAASAVLTACATTGTTAQTDRHPATTVEVDNQALLDMTIHVLRDGQRMRLGIATGLSKTRFTIPAGIMFGVTTLRFIADPIGANRLPVTEEITVSEGDEVVLRIPPY